VSRVLKPEKERAQISLLEGSEYEYFFFVTNTTLLSKKVVMFFGKIHMGDDPKRREIYICLFRRISPV